MLCPNCGLRERAGAAECRGCSLVFAKWRQRPPASARGFGGRPFELRRPMPRVGPPLARLALAVAVALIGAALLRRLPAPPAGVRLADALPAAPAGVPGSSGAGQAAAPAQLPGGWALGETWAAQPRAAEAATPSPASAQPQERRHEPWPAFGRNAPPLPPSQPPQAPSHSPPFAPPQLPLPKLLVPQLELPQLTQPRFSRPQPPSTQGSQPPPRFD